MKIYSMMPFHFLDSSFSTKGRKYWETGVDEWFSAGISAAHQKTLANAWRYLVITSRVGVRGCGHLVEALKPPTVCGIALHRTELSDPKHQG